jgi:hypothetical protein
MDLKTAVLGRDWSGKDFLVIVSGFFGITKYCFLHPIFGAFIHDV